MSTDDDFLFADEQAESTSFIEPWQLLIVDDDEAVHQVTRLALHDFEFGGRTLSLLHAHSAHEAKILLDKPNNIALALIDVVMEHESAGLELVRHIREVSCNRLIRIILRTGQPGQAPERMVIRDYDINDYKEKTELTIDKLYSCVCASLRSYRDLVALDHNRRGLEQVISYSAKVFRIGALSGFANGVLEQITALLFLDKDAIYANSIAGETGESLGDMRIVAAAGVYSDEIGKSVRDAVPDSVGHLIGKALAGETQSDDERHYVSSFRTDSGQIAAIFVSGINPLDDDDRRLIDLFCRNVSIAHDQLLLREDIDATQQELIFLLSEAVETRSPETGFHVRRVAEYAYTIARALGLPEKDCEIIHRAMPLHDLGKLGIPDAILHKHAKLEIGEWDIMKSHPQLGYNILSKSERPILRTAAIIAAQHHEKWDGTGYPNGLKGEEIHIYGRIGALADVFDALGSYRSYKEPWEIEKIIHFVEEQRGKQFDPAVTDCFLANIDRIIAIRDGYEPLAVAEGSE